MTKQYELVWIGGTESEMQESANGDWVKAEDYGALQSLNAELLADLEVAAAQLRKYETLHRAKGTEDSLAKAEVNAALASRFEETIANARNPQ